MKLSISALFFAIFALFFAIISLFSSAYFGFFKHGDIETCFVPNQNCEQLVVDKIDTAKENIDLQAYHLTNANISMALINAEHRGVFIRIILDKAAEAEADLFTIEGIRVWIDYKPAIAHNKIIIIDEKVLGTGSMNFTEAGAHRNAENYNFIKNDAAIKNYMDNFVSRLNVSRELP